MERFKQVFLNFDRQIFINTENISDLFFLYLKYSKYLDDDFAYDGKPLYKYFLQNIEQLSPYFWIITDEKTNRSAGFVYLDKLTGDSRTIHCAEVSACLFKNYWGGFTYDTAKKFFGMCFNELNLKKVKALIYPQNFRVKTLLKKCGFKKEGFLKSETIRSGKLQDIEIFSLIKER